MDVKTFHKLEVGTRGIDGSENLKPKPTAGKEWQTRKKMCHCVGTLLLFPILSVLVLVCEILIIFQIKISRTMTVFSK